MKKTRWVLFVGITLLLLYILYSLIQSQNDTESTIGIFLPQSPTSATFLHIGNELALEDGRGTVGETTMSVQGTPIYGDVDGDTVDDAVLILVNEDEPNGQQYLGLVIQEQDGFLGMNTVPLDTDDTSMEVFIRDKMVVVTYTQPERSVYYTLVGNQLEKRNVTGTVHTGYYTRVSNEGHFIPCDGNTSYVVSKDSRAYAVLEALYKEKMQIKTIAQEGMYAVVEVQDTQETGEADSSPDQAKPSVTISTVLQVSDTGTCTEEYSENKEN